LSFPGGDCEQILALLPLPLAHFSTLPDIWLRWRGCSIATLSAPTLTGLARWLSNHPWLVTFLTSLCSRAPLLLHRHKR